MPGTTTYGIPATWGGGSGSLASNWIVGEVFDNDTGAFIKFVYGQPTAYSAFTSSIDVGGHLVMLPAGTLNGSVAGANSYTFSNPGTYTLTGVLTASSVGIGVISDGHLVVTGVLTASSVVIGDGSEGRLVVTGAKAKIAISGNLGVGFTSDGTFVVEDGASASVGTFATFGGPNALSGFESDDGSFAVGGDLSFDNGTAKIENDSILSAQFIAVGNPYPRATDPALMIVDADSRVSTLQGIGVDINGLLEVLGGSSVSAPSLAIESESSAVEVSGMDSAIHLTGDTYVGDLQGGSASLDVKSGGLVVTQALALESPNAEVSIDSNSFIEVGQSSSSDTGLNISIDGTVSGSGEINADVHNNGEIVEDAGAIEIDGNLDGTGTTSLTDNDFITGTISITGAVGSEQTIAFDDDNQTLVLNDAEHFEGTVSGFQEGDAIDLTDVFYPSGNTNSLYPSFDVDTGELTLFSQSGVGLGDPVATLKFKGLDADTSFVATPDGKGGTTIALGQDDPTILELAEMDLDAYNQTRAPIGDFSYVTGTYPEVFGESDGFGAEEYKNGNQIVIAIRGTNIALDSSLINNLFADASWANGVIGLGAQSPSGILKVEVQDAVNFLEQVRANAKGDQITITGHSLGGAVAQMLGEASGLSAIGFNAPQAQQFYTALFPTTALEGYGYAPDSVNQNYRVIGDQVSLTGMKYGAQFSVQSPYPDAWVGVYTNHLLTTVIKEVKQVGLSDVTPYAYKDYPSGGVFGEGPNPPYEAPLPTTDLIFQGAQVPSGDPGVIRHAIVASVDAAAAGTPDDFYHVDPDAAYQYQLLDDHSSPFLRNVALPTGDGIASFSLSFFVDGAWSAAQAVQPTAIVSAPGDTSGVEFSALDGNGNPAIIPDGVFFDVSFATSGALNGVLSETIACFVSGTMIHTVSGDVAVEDITLADVLLDIDGVAAPVVWSGHRKVNCRSHTQPVKVQPVRVVANAFADDVPTRDLFLSPDHSVFVEHVLVPIKHLINGTSIAQMDIDEVSYFHVEVAHHTVVLANGLPAETYLDTGDRASFAGGAATALHPVWGSEARDITLIMDAVGYAPLRVTGPEVDAVRALVASRTVQIGSLNKGRMAAR